MPNNGITKGTGGGPCWRFTLSLMTKRSSTPTTVGELFALHESLRADAKVLYDKADAVLVKLLRAWKRDKSAKIDGNRILEIEDQFRGQTKAFAPGFAHRYKLKLRTIDPD